MQKVFRDLLSGEKQERHAFELALKQLAEMKRVGAAGIWPLKQEDIRQYKSVSGRVRSNSCEVEW